MDITYRSLQPNAVNAAIEFVKRGGRLLVPSQTRPIVIDRKAVERFERAGVTLLKAEGDGYRLTMGKSTVFLFPGQLQVEEILESK